MPGKLDACAKLLIAANEALQREVQARFAQEFFQSIFGLNFGLDQSLQCWQEIITKEKSSGTSFRQALLEILLNSPLVQDPIVTEFEEFQRARQTSAIDHLTKVHNRRFFDLAVAKEVVRASRYRQDLSLMLFDLNRFKEVNDARGHQTGDQLLALTGKLLTESLRTSDSAYRVGGDEFAVLLPQTAQPSAVVLAERLRKKFEEAVRPFDLGIPVSLAYGVATSPREATDPAALYSVADQRLYDFKRAIGSPRCAPRRFERIHLDKFDARVVVRSESAQQSADLLDFSLGGIGFRLAGDSPLPESFTGDLHLQVLPPVTVGLKKVYQRVEKPGVQRLGCAFAGPDSA